MQTIKKQRLCGVTAQGLVVSLAEWHSWAVRSAFRRVAWGTFTHPWVVIVHSGSGLTFLSSPKTCRTFQGCLKPSFGAAFRNWNEGQKQKNLAMFVFHSLKYFRHIKRQLRIYSLPSLGKKPVLYNWRPLCTLTGPISLIVLMCCLPFPCMFLFFHYILWVKEIVVI